MASVVLLSNDYAERAKARGACDEAVAWMRSAQHMSLRAMWETCPNDLWLDWIVSQAAIGNAKLRRRNFRARTMANQAYHFATGNRIVSVSASLRAYHSLMPWPVVEHHIRKWLGLQKKKEK